MSIEEREALFLQMANHGQYIAGEIVDLDFQPFPEVSSLVVQCGGQQYRVSCRLSGMEYRLRPFTLNSYVGKDLDEFRKQGVGIVIVALITIGGLYLGGVVTAQLMLMATGII